MQNLPDKSDWATSGHKKQRAHHIINSLFLDPEQLEQLAAWIRSYARSNELLCLDFAQFFPNYTTDGYHRYFSDGVHPNERGHAIMAQIARKLLFGLTEI